MLQNAFEKSFWYNLRPLSDNGHNIIFVSHLIFPLFCRSWHGMHAKIYGSMWMTLLYFAISKLRISQKQLRYMLYCSIGTIVKRKCVTFTLRSTCKNEGKFSSQYQQLHELIDKLFLIDPADMSSISVTTFAYGYQPILVSRHIFASWT